MEVSLIAHLEHPITNLPICGAKHNVMSVRVGAETTYPICPMCSRDVPLREINRNRLRAAGEAQFHYDLARGISHTDTDY